MLMDESDMPVPQVRITSRLIDSLYTEAMLLADEARSYFDDAGRDERATLQPFARYSGAGQSLVVLVALDGDRGTGELPKSDTASAVNPA